MGPWQTDDTTLPFFHAELIRSCSFLLLGKSTASERAKSGASVKITDVEYLKIASVESLQKRTAGGRSHDAPAVP